MQGVVETVFTPTTPSGTTSGSTGTSYTYSTGGASSNLGHTVQYQFDWGDGNTSGWLPVGTTSASHTWSSAGTYSVKAQARCATHTSIVSSLSGTLSVVITTAETVSTPTTPSGTTSGSTATSYTYSTGGASSNLGHTVEYQFDWGDGTTSSWGAASASHSWSSGGTYLVKARARCSIHTGITSSYSSSLSVVITVPARQ